MLINRHKLYNYFAYRRRHSTRHHPLHSNIPQVTQNRHHWLFAASWLPPLFPHPLLPRPQLLQRLQRRELVDVEPAEFFQQRVLDRFEQR